MLLTVLLLSLAALGGATTACTEPDCKSEGEVCEDDAECCSDNCGDFLQVVGSVVFGANLTCQEL
jgi:hypothetical protein